MAYDTYNTKEQAEAATRKLYHDSVIEAVYRHPLTTDTQLYGVLGPHPGPGNLQGKFTLHDPSKQGELQADGWFPSEPI